MKFLCVLCVLCGLQVSAFSLDREAFTFTHYDLHVRIEPEQQRLEVWGRVSLRNDSAVPQKNVALQISSSLSWHSIAAGGKPLEFASQAYTSDIDHTGVLSEAIVPMPQEVAPSTTVDLDIRYEGIISLDTTRLTRIGVPAEMARRTDWDQVSPSFTAVRGVGYVAWYPVAMESSSLAEGNTVFEALSRWKVRHAGTSMSVTFGVTGDMPLWFSGNPNLLTMMNLDTSDKAKYSNFTTRFGSDVPTFALAAYHKLVLKGLSSVNYLSGNDDAAKAYADAITKLNSFIPPARGGGGIQVLQLADPAAASFATEQLLLTPLPAVTPEVNLALIYALTRQNVLSSRAWIQDGLARYEQAAYVARESGRRAAIEYLNVHRPALLEAEKPAGAGQVRDAASQSLLNTTDEMYLQAKAQSVWWMLRDMVGEPALPIALLDYRAADDTQPAYMQRLIEKQAHRDLEWFFDDWVYRDRGLPDFRVDSVFPRQTMQGNYIVTVTIENLGGAGAEVPVIVRSPDGESIKRLEVRAKSKNSIRFDLASFPQEVVVNDGSVPESDVSNNVFTVKAAPETQ